MHLFAYGGTAFTQRNCFGHWPSIPSGSLQDYYGLVGESLSYGFGRLDERCFLILRQRQNLANRGGIPFTLLLDPDDLWEAYGWNAAWFAASLFGGPTAPGFQLLNEPERFTQDALAAALEGLEATALPADSADADQVRALWVAASLADEPMVLSPGALGLSGRPGPQWLAGLLAGLPPCFRPGNGWLVGGGAAHGRAFGARLILDEQGSAKGVLEQLQPARRYWPAWEAVETHPETPDSLAKWRDTPTWKWQEPVMEVLNRTAFLSRVLAGQGPTDEEYDWLLRPEQEQGPLASEMQRASLRNAVSGEEPLPAAHTRYLLRACLDKNEAVPAAVVARMDAAALEQGCRRRNIEPWKPPACLELRSPLLLEVMKLYLRNEDAEFVPTIVSNLLEMEEAPPLDEGELKELAVDGLRAVTERAAGGAPGSLENWAALRDGPVWPEIRGGLRALARRRAEQGAEKWALDYLLFAEDPGGVYLRADSPGAGSAISGVLLDVLHGQYPFVTPEELENWLSALANSPLRRHIPVDAKVKFADRVSVPWLAFRMLVDLYEGSPADPKRLAAKTPPDKQRGFLRSEFHDLLKTRRELACAPRLREICDLLDVRRLERETEKFLESLEPPVSDEKAFDSWLKGLSALDLKSKHLKESTRRRKVAPRAQARRTEEPPPETLRGELARLLFGVGQEGQADAEREREDLRKLLQHWGATSGGRQVLREVTAAESEQPERSALFAERFIEDRETLESLMQALEVEERQPLVACLAGHAPEKLRQWATGRIAAHRGALEAEDELRSQQPTYEGAVMRYLLENLAHPPPPKEGARQREPSLAETVAKSLRVRRPQEFTELLQLIAQRLGG